MRRCRPRLHCFGHIHEGWGAQRVEWAEGSMLDAENPKDCVKRMQGVEVNEHRMEEERAAYVDISSVGEHAIKFGRETLMVNASIMDVQYEPVQGPWLVDLDLERASDGENIG
ncbi:hypothetical protein OPT61_g10501 [Boeremia exigua]|uniref:Uncharacterized protein n=1 Tax=Boeremia exigua TaxID=749465 RepID=A0ACC2HPD9_9PLEO|nr:hypothetical protein OPT61_g10501 [Boeremia exigua]